MFSGMAWYESIERPGDPSAQSAWYTAVDPEPEWNVCLLRAALSYCAEVRLWDDFRVRFAGIAPADVASARAVAEDRGADLPIWEIASELVVAAYLQHVCGWKLLRYEPPGNGLCRGDWEFESPSGRVTFVEVKTIRESVADYFGSGALQQAAKKCQHVLARAYKQLPCDERATLVVLIGKHTVRPLSGLMLSGPFVALFGPYIVRFPIYTPNARISYAGPSFYDMLVGHTKRRRLGAVAGLSLRGLCEPTLEFYAIHNPFAHSACRLPSSDFGDHLQFPWTEGVGNEIGVLRPHEAWQKLRVALLAGDDGCAVA